MNNKEEITLQPIEIITPKREDEKINNELNGKWCKRKKKYIILILICFIIVIAVFIILFLKFRKRESDENSINPFVNCCYNESGNNSDSEDFNYSDFDYINQKIQYKKNYL